MPRPRKPRGPLRRRRHLDYKADRGARNLRELKMAAEAVRVEAETARRQSEQQASE